MALEPKRKISVTLDADLVAEVEDGENLSARVSAALRADLESRHRQRALRELLDRLADERGPLDSTEDQAEIARFMCLLGGPAEEPHESLRAG